MSPGFHHFHKRVRIHQKHEPYPHPNKWKNLMDRLIYFVAAFGIIMTIPQVARVWFEQNAAGVSAVSWFAYTLTSMFWLTYGIMHKEKPIIFTYFLWVIMNLLVAVGALLYS